MMLKKHFNMQELSFSMCRCSQYQISFCIVLKSILNAGELANSHTCRHAFTLISLGLEKKVTWKDLSRSKLKANYTHRPE